MTTGLYLYCVGEGDKVESLGLKGIRGTEVFVVGGSGLLAAVQQIDPSFSADDAKLVTEWILTHQAVVDSVWEKFDTIVPFGFGTVIVPKDGKTAEENLKEWLDREKDNLNEKMGRLRGKAEYGVQISWNPEIVAPRVTKHDSQITEIKASLQSKSGGTAYLLKQKLEELLRKRLETAADVYFKEFFQRLKGCVENIRVEKVRKEEPPRQMLMNLSCLMAKGESSMLGKELEKIGQVDGFFVRFTGPWPPYSFA